MQTWRVYHLCGADVTWVSCFVAFHLCGEDVTWVSCFVAFHLCGEDVTWGPSLRVSNSSLQAWKLTTAHYIVAPFQPTFDEKDHNSYHLLCRSFAVRNPKENQRSGHSMKRITILIIYFAAVLL
ncbi:hypothetical protein AVEN_174664-1 [Araneus ventricosus]|uniref:Uncharacterized protein n=1 Tax=Araneus ventricosus TaxID=182803 RepID=A0A4Y2QL98_ARAVE|nr:hypothetical protein AVEN_174664-1 [Araneus ventricosus]